MAVSTLPTLPGYNINPSPQGGSGAYGAVPGAIGIPNNLYEQLGVTAPGLTAATPQATSLVQSELAGQLTSAEQKALQDQAAAWGVTSGQPMTGPGGIATNRWDTSRLLATMGRQKQGLADYQSLLGSIGATQTPQALAADIASRNATMGAAPDPQAAFQAQMDAWEKMYNRTSGGTGSRGGGMTIGGGGGSPFPASPMKPRDINAEQAAANAQSSSWWNSKQTATPTQDPYTQWYNSTFGGLQFGPSSSTGTYGAGDALPGYENLPLSTQAQEMNASAGSDFYFDPSWYSGE